MNLPIVLTGDGFLQLLMIVEITLDEKSRENE